MGDGFVGPGIHAQRPGIVLRRCQRQLAMQQPVTPNGMHIDRLAWCPTLFQGSDHPGCRFLEIQGDETITSREASLLCRRIIDHGRQPGLALTFDRKPRPAAWPSGI